MKYKLQLFFTFACEKRKRKQKAEDSAQNAWEKKKKELQLFMFNSSFVKFIRKLFLLFYGTTSSYIKWSCIV